MPWVFVARILTVNSAQKTSSESFKVGCLRLASLQVGDKVTGAATAFFLLLFQLGRVCGQPVVCAFCRWVGIRIIKRCTADELVMHRVLGSIRDMILPFLPQVCLYFI